MLEEYGGPDIHRGKGLILLILSSLLALDVMPAAYAFSNNAGECLLSDYAVSHNFMYIPVERTSLKAAVTFTYSATSLGDNNSEWEGGGG